MAKHRDHGDENLEQIESTLSKAEFFIEKYQKYLIYGGIAILIIVGAYFGYQNWYKAPLEKEAQAQMFVAERYFEMDSLDFALNGDGGYLGFIDIADRYSSTKAGNLANYYIGVAYLHLGMYEDAISYLEKYNGKGLLDKALAIGNIGDAYSELNDYVSAAKFYQKAAKASSNRMTAPRFLLKSGLALEKDGNYNEAIKMYEQLKTDFFDTSEGRDAEKRIIRAKTLMKN